ncbi:MAG: type II toxin-antitoxin system PemK/MazF family toxin [Candidatus Bipolaricaulota bacterium]|nr:type II toxin-antitoxin system PemK/MazF family toxin [Candidatus Bipolaricaulota bacterium]
MTRSLRRGDIVRLQLSPIVGSEQAGERPALVISPDVINEHSPVILKF